MVNNRFLEIVHERLNHFSDIIDVKGEEYSRNNDRLNNFKTQARMGLKENETPESALWGDLRKHLASIVDLINDLEEGKLPSAKIIHDKFDDYHVYGFLLEALIQERKDNAKT